jgi:N-acetylmuramoyl-L-alanine amidase
MPGCRRRRTSAGRLLSISALAGLCMTAAAACSSVGPLAATSVAVTTPAPRSQAASATAPAAAGPVRHALSGRVVVIDPGHNGGNAQHAAQINRLVNIGNGVKACDTTGTQTDAGYPESAYTFDVSVRLAALLRAAGATVVLTRSNNTGFGPCVTERAAIGNRAHANAAISIHGDGAPASGHGFSVIVPAGIGRNDAIVAPSRRLGIAVRDAFRSGTGEPLSSYAGTTTAGIIARQDLGGLNLSTVPKVFIECGNMRNAGDAQRMSDPAWRQRAAAALAAGITRFITAA